MRDYLLLSFFIAARLLSGYQDRNNVARMARDNDGWRRGRLCRKRLNLFGPSRKEGVAFCLESDVLYKTP